MAQCALYDSQPMLQDAVERNIEIIGEAVNKLLNIEPMIAISNARRIVDARNKIIHGYDEIENTQIWAIIINHLPQLYAETMILLNSTNEISQHCSKKAGKCGCLCKY